MYKSFLFLLRGNTIDLVRMCVCIKCTP